VIKQHQTASLIDHDVRRETSTHELQYVYLLLYLEGKASKDMTPLEQYVSVQVTHGEIDWMPTGRSIGMQNLQEQGKMKENTLIHFRDAMELICTHYSTSRDCVRLRMLVCMRTQSSLLAHAPFTSPCSALYLLALYSLG
jgi:hypothetical protein